ncbi:putative membrane-bound dehydrogenase domain-containing protein [Prosthecobacter debontii]|uniref:Putative membrane-bound dehydrogenase domain-containing protein n=1 Tax=Prosthecobacter debontii TaxID=48467 RepID=A0A1T4XUG7_9BACT|nr:family 16 glycoside hydrolase [Prosthecobacter debontii]SKA92788.1 putative membrane-bound dehydrogenase domain-containing protein [Prosthecobacter debontii]
MRFIASFFMLITLASMVRAESVSLFDGKTLDGWDYDPSIWRVEDGMITGGSTTEKIKQNYFICTNRSYQNFDLKMKIKCSGDPTTGLINSGIQIRSLRVPGGHHMSGYQVDCGQGWFGKIYDEFRRNKVIAEPLDEAALDKAVDVYGWNEYRIRAEGTRIQVWINDVAAIDYTETDSNIALDGQIGPQVHSGGACLVQVKDITLEELPPTSQAPTWKSLGGVEGARKLVAPPLTPKPQASSAQPKRDISYNNIQGTPRTAQEQRKLFHLPEGYDIELVVQESDGLGKFVSVYFDQRGRMWTQTALEYPVDANENPAAAEAVYEGRGKDKVLVYPREALNQKIPSTGLTDPTIFAEGLAIPLGILPWGNGDTCYIQHGHDLKLFKDTNGDGQADTHEVVLTGFGVQDSHLFPHQFTRAPGGWIWMAQGLFNNSQVHKPGSNEIVDYPKCGMARMRPDGSQFEVTSVGPNNIWGLAITGEGEAFIQEANDYGYPIMPFHEYAYYPGGMEALKKSYQPAFPPQAEFRMGGTGLSGLALIESGPLRDAKAAHIMAVANPITSKVQTLAMHRDGAYWKLEQLPDLITCDDPFFRPVGLTNGPDGCIYIVDWYNKIISHNEVPRSHPDRDKTRGRIWRIVPKKASRPIPDFTQLSTDALIPMLGQKPIGRMHMAWQTLADRKALPATHWAVSDYAAPAATRQIREYAGELTEENMIKLLAFAKPSLPGPLAPSSRSKQLLPIREAYDREFERFLVRMFLEKQPDVVAAFLDSEAASKVPLEARLLAALALEPKASAARVARLLPLLDRSPNEEELLRLAQFPHEEGVAQALRQLLTQPKSQAVVAEKLLAQRTKLDPSQLAPFLTDAAHAMLQSKEARSLALQLISGFQLQGLEDELITWVKSAPDVPLLHTLRDLRSTEVKLFAKLAQEPPDSALRDAAVEALAASSSEEAGAQFLSLYPALTPAQRRGALKALSSSKSGAKTVVQGLLDETLPQSDLEGSTVERLAIVLGDDPLVTQLQKKLGGVFRDVLLLDGRDTAWVDSQIHLEGPFTVEAWVRLSPGISNEDSLLGSQGQIDLNFFRSQFRVWIGGGVNDIVTSKKPMTPDLWTHLAVTRDAEGVFRLYQNGELDATSSRRHTGRFENCKIGWSGPHQGTSGVITEFRVWKSARSATEIRSTFDRSLEADDGHIAYPTSKSRFSLGARLAKTLDTPPLLTEEQAQALETKFAKYSALTTQGNAQAGKALSALCLACHQIGNTGGQIGPNLSGAGAMGLEAVLRNILTPNAAMEPGYRIFRMEMTNGDLLDAFYVNEDTQAYVVRQPGMADRRIPKTGVRHTQFIRRSLMPEGLLDGLQDQQVADLLAYLMTLKG